MKSYSENITVGSPLKLPITGNGFNVLRSAGGDVLTIEFIKGGTAETNRIEGVGKGFKSRFGAGFDGIKISTTVEGVVDFIVLDADDDLEIWFNTDEVIIGNADAGAVPVRSVVGAPLAVHTEAGDSVQVKTDPAEPLAVSFAGTVEPVLGVVTVDNTNAEAIPVQQQALATIDDKAPVTVGTVATALVSDATLKRLRIRNSHDTAIVAIGGAGITLANGAIQLQPGDVFIEEDAAGAAWYAISDTADIVVQVQGLK